MPSMDESQLYRNGSGRNLMRRLQRRTDRVAPLRLYLLSRQRVQIVYNPCAVVTRESQK